MTIRIVWKRWMGLCVMAILLFIWSYMMAITCPTPVDGLVGGFHILFMVLFAIGAGIVSIVGLVHFMDNK